MVFGGGFMIHMLRTPALKHETSESTVSATLTRTDRQTEYNRCIWGVKRNKTACFQKTL